jgi:hypothetical protein
MRPTRVTRTAVCLLALASAAALTACGKHVEPGVDEPAREGLAIDVAGVAYNVFITRELNPKITPDQAYYNGEPPGKDRTLYGIFIQACNEGTKTRMSTDDFLVEDNQGNEFEPIELEEENPFAYKPRTLAKGDCIPADGSVAQQGPTAGSMLLFEFPLENTENRPLELDIRGPYDPATGERESKQIELDL